MTIEGKPHYLLSATTLADWVESQPDRWWSVDGDPFLMSVVDFPCPSDELAPAIRQVGENLLVLDKNPASQARGEEIAADRLDALASTENRKRRKIFRLAWEGSGEVWLLLEDDAMVG